MKFCHRCLLRHVPGYMEALESRGWKEVDPRTLGRIKDGGIPNNGLPNTVNGLNMLNMCIAGRE